MCEGADTALFMFRVKYKWQNYAELSGVVNDGLFDIWENNSLVFLLSLLSAFVEIC